MSENLKGKTLRERYELLEQLGSGGFGTIYLAKDTSTSIGGMYVVKHFSPHYDNEAQLDTAMRLFRQEADSLKKLGNHPQIPRIIDFFEAENNFFLVQELIEGKDLRQEFTDTARFEQSQVIKLLTDVLEVLKFIHDSGYIHRDIKPSNLIRNRFNDKFFVIDFGAVKEQINPKNISTIGEFTRTVGILSPGYTPDEQLHGKPKFYSDIYALGMVAIEALIKVHPNNLSRNINFELIWRDFLLPHLDYDSNFLDLIDKMVEKDWQKRYQSATQVLDDLSQINIAQLTNLYKPLTSTTGENKPEPESEPVPPIPPQKFSFIKAIAGVSIVGAIAFLAWLLFNNSRSNSFVTYENEQIRVDYPKAWKRENKSNFLSTTVVFTSPKENPSDSFQERVTVVVENSSRPLSLTEYTKQAVMQIENLSNFILSPPRPTKLGRSVGKYVIYQGKDKDIKVKRHEVWTVNYQKIYSVVYTSQPSKYDKFLPTAEKIIESLEILK